MIPMHILTLIMSALPGPCILVLQPSDPTVESNGNSRIVPIWIGSNEATQLGIALEERHFARPLTHDLFIDALTNLDSVIDHVLIDKVQGPTFFSKLTLRHHDRLIELDARPSDSIALALRQQAPLYMTEEVLDHSSYPYLVANRKAQEQVMEDFHHFIKDLTPEDFNETSESQTDASTE